MRHRKVSSDMKFEIDLNDENHTESTCDADFDSYSDQTYYYGILDLASLT